MPLPRGSARHEGGFCLWGWGAAGAFGKMFGRCFWKCCVCPGGAGFDYILPVLVHGSGVVLLLWIVAVCLFFRHVVLL